MYFLLKLLSLCRVKSTINAVAFGPLIDSLKEQKTLFHTVTHVIPTEKNYVQLSMIFRHGVLRKISNSCGP